MAPPRLNWRYTTGGYGFVKYNIAKSAARAAEARPPPTLTQNVKGGGSLRRLSISTPPELLSAESQTDRSEGAMEADVFGFTRIDTAIHGI